MIRRPHILLAPALVVAAVIALAGCSAATPTSAPSEASDGGTSPSTASSPAASTGPKACELVTAAVLQSTLGVAAGTGSEKSGFGGPGSTECDYTGIIVQVSLQADTYYPAASYSPAGVPGSAAPASGDRGYVAPSAILVVKGQTGVFVTLTHQVTIDQGQALATAIVAGL
ncbi:MAG: hypothetical protein V4479_08670 [Actinomycetota bacterium]